MTAAALILAGAVGLVVRPGGELPAPLIFGFGLLLAVAAVVRLRSRRV